MQIFLSVEEEVKDGVEIAMGVGSVEGGVHVEDWRGGDAVEVHGGEPGGDRLHGRDRGNAEGWVEGEGLAGVDTKVALQVKEFLAEEEAGVGMGGLGLLPAPPRPALGFPGITSHSAFLLVSSVDRTLRTRIPLPLPRTLSPRNYRHGRVLPKEPHAQCGEESQAQG